MYVEMISVAEIMDETQQFATSEVFIFLWKNIWVDSGGEIHSGLRKPLSVGQV